MKTILPRLLNYILYAAGILIAGFGLLLRWKIPHGPAGRDASLWGLDKHNWQDLHLWGGCSIVLLVVWHLWLHRKWIMNVACQKRSVWLFVGLLAPVILVGALALTPLVHTPNTSGECNGNGYDQSMHKNSGRNAEYSEHPPMGKGQGKSADGSGTGKRRNASQRSASEDR